MGVTPQAIIGAAAINSATSGGTSSGGSQNTSVGDNASWSQTYGTAASNMSAQQANSANNAAMAAWQQMTNFNAAEAQKTREWQEKMANTVYQRTVKDMIKAGINPVLAAGMGLGTASAGSGATATAGNPTTFMPNTFADSQSASVGHQESQGTSWQQSVNGLAYLADAISGAIQHITSGIDINVALNGLKTVLNDDIDGDGKVSVNDVEESSIRALENVFGWTDKQGTTFRNIFNTGYSPKYNAQKEVYQRDFTAGGYKSPQRINESNWK